MKICMIISTPFPPEDGIGYHVYYLSKKMMEKGHEVTVITRGSYKFIETSIFEGINVIKVFYIPLYPFHVNIHGFFVNKLLRGLKTNFDIIHVHTPLSPVIKNSVPVISTVHSSITEDIRHMEKTNYFTLPMLLQAKFSSYPLLKKLINTSCITTTVSDSLSDELKNDYAFYDSYVVSNGVDCSELVPINKPNGGKYLLYVGRLSYRKGLFELIEATKDILKEKSLKLYIVGKGEWEKLIKNKVKDYQLQDYVLFKGHVSREELVSLYQHATIFIMPSRYETGPLTVLEAMSCGKPVIATSVGIVPEVIENMSNGIMIDPNSPFALSEAINTLLNDKSLRVKLGSNARKTVETKYTWDIVATNVEQYYYKALKREI